MSNMPQHDAAGFLVDNTIDIIDGITGPSGTTYVRVKQFKTTAWIATDAFCPEPAAAFRELKAKGIKVYTPQDKGGLVNQVSERTYFPERPIGERVGWSPVGFCYPDGTVFPLVVGEIPVAYATGAVSVRALGTLDTWKDQVANFVAGQHLPVFCMMLAFAAPLLSLTSIQGNYLVMLSGMARKGKTTCVELMASICGPVLDGPGGRYYLKFNNTMNRLEEWMESYSDMPMIIDELSSYGTKSSRMTDFRTFVHHLAGVDTRGRMGDALQPATQARTIIAMTSNDTAQELLSQETPDAAAAVEDRVIELPVPTGEEGAFNALPPDAAEARRFAEMLRDRVGCNYGTAMPAFLDRLAEFRRKDNQRVIDGIVRRMRSFEELPEVIEAGPVSSRILGVISLGYAAGQLAKYLDVLPEHINCEAAAIHCLRLHLGLRAEADPVQRLLGWAGANKIYDLRGNRQSPLSDKALKQRGAFVIECKNVPQLCVAPALFRLAFPNHKAMLSQLARRGVLKTEDNGRRQITHAPVRADGRNHRMYTFTIPDFNEWLEGYNFPRTVETRAKRKP